MVEMAASDDDWSAAATALIQREARLAADAGFVGLEKALADTRSRARRPAPNCEFLRRVLGAGRAPPRRPPAPPARLRVRVERPGPLGLSFGPAADGLGPELLSIAPRSLAAAAEPRLVPGLRLARVQGLLCRQPEAGDAEAVRVLSYRDAIDLAASLERPVSLCFERCRRPRPAAARTDDEPSEHEPPEESAAAAAARAAAAIVSANAGKRWSLDAAKRKRARSARAEEDADERDAAATKRRREGAAIDVGSELSPRDFPDGRAEPSRGSSSR